MFISRIIIVSRRIKEATPRRHSLINSPTSTGRILLKLLEETNKAKAPLLLPCLPRRKKEKKLKRGGRDERRDEERQIYVSPSSRCTIASNCPLGDREVTPK